MPPAKGIHKPVAPQPVIAWESVIVRLPITLGQFLKVANLVSSGGEAKMRVSAGEVLVNGEVETRRGHKLAPRDVVSLGGSAARVGIRSSSETSPGSSATRPRS
jgi:ribosome-associated protein